MCSGIYVWDNGYYVLPYAIKKCLFSTTNIGPEAQTETRTKCLQSSKDRNDRKWQDRNKPSCRTVRSANGFNFTTKTKELIQTKLICEKGDHIRLRYRHRRNRSVSTAHREYNVAEVFVRILVVMCRASKTTLEIGVSGAKQHQITRRRLCSCGFFFLLGWLGRRRPQHLR